VQSLSDSDFDPRFDPAFQPGYDPSKHAPAAPRRPKEPRRQVQQQDEYIPPPTDEPVRPAITSLHDGPPVRRVVNPLVIVLWALSALFVVMGIYGLQLIGERVTALGANGSFGSADYYLLQAYTFGAPLLIVLGLATATGTVFLLAARWKHSA
jgi:hypothetical protein